MAIHNIRLQALEYPIQAMLNDSIGKKWIHIRQCDVRMEAELPVMSGNGWSEQRKGEIIGVWCLVTGNRVGVRRNSNCFKVT